MRITKAVVNNFRILENAEIDFDKDTTLIVGRNNSGKTSLTEVFYKFLGSDQGFRFEDFSISRLAELRKAYVQYCAFRAKQAEDGSEEEINALEDEYKSLIPSIQLRVCTNYDKDDNLANISDFIMDLDETRTDITILCKYETIKPEKMFDDFKAVSKKYGDDLSKFLKKNHSSYYSKSILAIDSEDEFNSREVSRNDIENIFLPRFIYAQNQLDDLSTDKTQGLSKSFGKYYDINNKGNEQIEQIEEILNTISEDLNTKYDDLFSSIFEDLKTFGIDSITSLSELKVMSLFEVEKVLKGNTQLFYKHGEDGDMLPESHNGLGYTKLIFTILQFISFFEEFDKREKKPGFQTVFVEEPEAHLHPQMQYVFIKNIREFIKKKKGWNVQVVITTHSSHIVAESGFECIRYFDNSTKPLQVKNLSDFKSDLLKTNPDNINFLEQYMTLHRCDLFFADKVILIEGTVERLLLPEMIKNEASKLLNQYLSVIEVGGAYAVKFKELLEFINVQTLIITDIDSVDPSKHYAACSVVTTDSKTSNTTLKSWLPKEDTITNLLAMDDAKKISKKIRVAYQIPDADATGCGRSFEEAFILSNAKKLSENSSTMASAKAFLKDDKSAVKDEAELKASSYETAEKIDKKTDFAFDIMSLKNWETPKYIKEGLEWLSKTP